MRLTEIQKYLTTNGLAMALIFLLWLILFDSKALERLKESKLKKLMYVPILAYCFQIIANIIFIIKNIRRF
jgi:hypothetical protein